ncbi:MAG: hypothetical protein IPP78_13940 [Holophagaceae bacterium]|nr:hypothetical protein [Holophagaceae bacterium]
MPSSIFQSVRRAFRTIAETVVPEAVRLDEQSWLELEQIIGVALEAKPSGLRRQLLLFIRVLDVLPLFRYGRTFQSLDPRRRELFLLGIQDAPLLLLRRGFWGLRTLIFMGYYGREQGRAETGYRADPRGWEAPR